MKYAIVTFGCRVNQADSLHIEGELLERGATAASVERADLVVVNTCSVTASADQGARQTIRRIARDNPHAQIVVTGCYATSRSAEAAALPGVIRVVRIEQKEQLVSALESGTAQRFGDGDGACGAAIVPGVAGRTAYTLRVQTGCNEGCSYCIIPSTRGAGRSRPIRDLLEELERVHVAGFKEIALTGVHLGSYGLDLAAPSSLLELLQTLNRRTPEGLLLRISSLEPMNCTDEIVDLLAGSKRFAPHVHLPLQHASDRMLRAMRRPYTLDRYRRLADDIRRRLPDAAIGSDVIVGFPGETSSDVELNLAYLESSPLTHLHVFPYSDRPGTAASVLPLKVGGAEIRERARLVRDVGRRLTQQFHRAQIGSIRPALTIEDGSLAVTDNYLKVRIPEGRARNEWIRVRILTEGPTMTGEIVKD